LQHLVLAIDREGHPSLEHVPPVRAVALVVGQPLEQRGRVDVLLERHELDRVPVDLLVPGLDGPVIVVLGVLLGNLWHSSLPSLDFDATLTNGERLVLRSTPVRTPSPPGPPRASVSSGARGPCRSGPEPPA